MLLRTIGLFGLLSVAAAAAPVRVQDAYEIKLKKNSKGDVFTHSKQESEDAIFKLEGPDGSVLSEKKEAKAVVEEYKETILDKEKGKRAVKLRREYRKATVKTGDKETPLAYDGKTLTIEKKDGKYHFTLEDGKELLGKDAELLDRSFNKPGGDDSDDDDLEKAFLPKKPVKANETWKFDPAAIVKVLEKDSKTPLPVDKSKMTGQGKLARVYKKDGRQFGTFDIDIQLPLKGELAMGKGAAATVQDGSKMHFRAKFDGCIDGTSTDGTMDGSMELNLIATLTGPDGKELKMTVRSLEKGKQSETELSKK
jgi:hypothetical protein